MSGAPAPLLAPLPETRSSVQGSALPVSAGALTVRVPETLPFADFRRAYQLLDHGGLHGKVVLTPDAGPR